ncbi:ectoine synthase [Vreelandella hamiltonii]|uniref:L-ectoine synthase n=1 Tax=Halomonas johnsoniae TaxID=502832 RepID=A0ABQ2WCU5_9GAMM|nr:ectoine synthase [Halomonas johnsoniae]GGW46895.1 L-ectoine synthase [Halomonas johnsoniae]
MKVLTTPEMKNCTTITEEKFTSIRAITSQYNKLFSIHETTVHKNKTLELCYENHDEYVYVIEGRGELHNYKTGEKHLLEPGTIYHVEKNERHLLKTHERMRGVCIFTPACKGDERHNENGSY